MTVVDSSVWIDLLKGRSTRQVQALLAATRSEIVIGDIVLMEVLQGSRSEADAAAILKKLENFTWQEMAGFDVAQQAARNFRILRAAGTTPRSQIDLIIATFCIVHGHHLLHADRDFDLMARHLPLSFAIEPQQLP